jgi:Trk K+ transport system NAD-binding subunit
VHFIEPDPTQVDQALRLNNLDLPGNLLELSIGRNEAIIIPHGNTQVELGDRLTILGNIEDMLEAECWLESTRAV